ncbi:MAG: hypothetical protein CMJ33_04480 [Phycisphaerae bacterium]|nr:hypothetical protein [Phycisphaerae bacterium]
MTHAVTRIVSFCSLTSILLVGLAAQADDYLVTDFSAEVDASASGSDYESGDYDSDQDSDQTDSVDQLPINADASAATNIGGGSGYGSVSGSVGAGGINLNASGAGSGYGSEFDGSGDGDGSGQFDLAFTVASTMVVRIELYAVGDGSGNIGYGSASFFADGALVASASSDEDFYDEEIIEYTLIPGVSYGLTAYGGGGGFSDLGGGSDAYGDGSVTITTLCSIEDELVIGENAFDTTPVGTPVDCDLTGLCDPGPFGTDIIYAAKYFHFNTVETTEYTFSTCGITEFDTRLAILADGCDPSSVVACLDDTPGCAEFTTELTAALEGGRQYTIVVGGFSPAQNGPGLIEISAVPVALAIADVGGSVEAYADADFFGCNGQPSDSDSDEDVFNPTSMSDLPVSVNASAATCCSSGGSGSSVDASLELNLFTANAQSAAGSCGDSNACVSSSSSTSVDVIYALDVLTISEATIEWSLFGDFGGVSKLTILGPEGNTLLNESQGLPINDGSTVLTLGPGVYRLNLVTSAASSGACGVPEPVANASVTASLVAIQNPADIDADGAVNGTDLAILLGSWGICLGCPADFNGDGVVDGIDLAILLGNWTG